ncbi:DeoR family transcriptional regulator [Aliiglaciecola sp. 3_MG-2023]|uniref:DeoR family transcriptional regulator n=1 Tax=Aliiglaciecola sp. 3_MG-2023 TaxID=3062644 RepID=UPI0026E3003D|nr:DeoR family transcriptional regulator [Aliiglaciecola sp. 3_MG-2023]MDO6692815.1 DeoR family transcriptional regulator [Aliiglaciecola sp. 3_MG-2023]
MPQNKRQVALVKHLQAKGFVSIDELASYFDVTPQTIRRDLNYLDEIKLVVRRHGGAEITNSSTTANTSYQTRKIMNLESKEAIANELVKLIPNGASLFINIGTTTETIARALLNHQNLNIVTNNIHVATLLSAKEDFTVIVAAGEVRHRDGGIIGEATCDFISQFQMDFGIIGISGISQDGSLLDFDFREVKVAQAIIDNSNCILLAADHSKFGRSAMVKQGSITQVDHLFTDQKLSPEIAELLVANEVQAHIIE